MKRSWAFVPFIVLALVHLVALLTNAGAVAVPTKFALMPALLLALLVAVPSRRSEVVLWAGLALLAAWAGDVLLADPGEVGFLIGLGACLIAHLAYLLLYLRPLRRRRLTWWPLLFAVWWGVLLVLLLPHVGALAVPVALYGLVLCAAAAASTVAPPVVAVGAVLFLVSDTVLALRFFLPGFSLVQADFLIMLAYLGGQGLIIAGAVAFEQHRVAAGRELA